MNNDMTYCTGRGCKAANRCKRYTESPETNVTVYCINPPTRIHCITGEPKPIERCDLFLPNNDSFSKVIENDIGE